MAGYLFEDVMDLKQLGYKTFVVSDATEGDDNYFDGLKANGIVIIDSTPLLQDNYKCPKEMLQCPLSGNCIHEDRLCDGRMDCNDGFDEDPKEMISDCCDELVISGFSTLSALQNQKYMGVYEKIDCSRLD